MKYTGLLGGIVVWFVLFLSVSSAQAGPYTPIVDWREKTPESSPQKLNGASMAYDRTTGKIVLFGGMTASGASDETWTWDGENWTRRQDMPAARLGGAMAWDPDRGRLIYFGGYGPGLAMSDETWAWKGGDWTTLSPANRPPALAQTAMATDIGRGEIVLFGGRNSSGNPTSQTWTWNGDTWVEKSPAQAPPSLESMTMDYHPGLGRVIMFGGANGTGSAGETWSWDGGNWRKETQATSPPARYFASLAFDPGRGEIVMFGGRDETGFYSDTWTYGIPAGVTGTWVQRSPSQSPPARSGAGMAYDEARGELVLFGGEDSSNIDKDDTWLWDGENWSSRNPANKPPSRSQAAMAFDPVRGEIVLFGGASGQINNTVYGDTWVWDGNNWHQKNPSSSPSPRYGVSMGFDYELRKIVLFGGIDSSGRPADTWAWDGNEWAQISTSESPVGRNTLRMTWDDRSPGLAMFGGFTDVGGPPNDVWLISGGVWRRVQSSPAPTGRTVGNFAYYQGIGGALVYGGIYLGSPLNDTWTWDGQGERWTEHSPGRGPRRSPPRRWPSIRFAARSCFSARSVSVTPTTRPGSSSPRSPNPGPRASPADGGSFTIGEEVTTEFSCSEAPGGPGLASCVDSNGANPPQGGLDTSSLGTHTYSVSATSTNGLTSTAEISYEVVKAVPTITAVGAVDANLGEVIAAEVEFVGGYEPGGEIVFSAYGSDDETCSGDPAFESDPVLVTGEGTYGSPGFTPSAAGAYRWVASYTGDENNESVVTECGALGSVSTVVEPPPPPPPPPVVDLDPEEPPLCPTFQARSKVMQGKPQPPFGKGRKAAGILLGVKTDFDATVKFRPYVSYRVGGERRRAKLGLFTVRVDRERLLRLSVPAKMKRDFRRAGQRLRGAKVRLVLASQVKPHGAPDSCFQQAPRRQVALKVTGIAKRAALRVSR